MFRDHKKEEKVLGKFEEEHAHCNYVILPKLILVNIAAPAVAYFVQAGVLFNMENTIFLPILANFGYLVANLRTFGVLFQAYILWWCAKIDKYEVCILLAQARHNRWQRHPQVKRVQSQDANLPAAVGCAAMRAAHVSLPTH